MARTRTNSEARQERGPRVRLEPKLEITGRTFSNDAARRLVNDSIVPALVDKFLQSRMNLLVPVGRRHNVSQP
jgi:hypothetical protein